MNVALGACGLLLLAGFRYGLALRGTDHIDGFVTLLLVQAGIYIGAVGIVLRSRSKAGRARWILAAALLFRGSLIFEPINLSTDLYRYIWDGRVQGAGINPYRYVPADPALQSLRDDTIYPSINRREYARTIYPPLAQLTFFATTRLSESVTWMKLTMTGFDAIAMILLIQLLKRYRRPPEHILIYAWHPVAVWEFAGNGHMDAIVAAMVTLALIAHDRRNPCLTGAALAGAGLAKLFPLVLGPAFYKRWDWKMPAAIVAVAVLAYLPYLDAGWNAFGFLEGYSNEEALDSTLRQTLLIAAPAGAWILFPGSPLAAAAAFTAALAPKFPWYFTWWLPLLTVAPVRPLLLFTALSPLLYLMWAGDLWAAIYGILWGSAVVLWIAAQPWRQHS